MFTIFDLIALVFPIVGAIVCAKAGWEWFGSIGVICGAFIGIMIGWIFARLPLIIGSRMLRSDLNQFDSISLHSQLETRYYIAHLIIAELLIRGESIESFRDYVKGLMDSGCPARLASAELITKIWPEIRPSFTSNVDQNIPEGT